MKWVLFVAGAVMSWGAYGALLHQGQTQLGNPLKALLCVGVAYFLIGVLVPVAGLSAQGALSGFDRTGLITATIAGALGAAGAACIIYSFRFGGLPLYVMPLVFGGAPIVNVLLTMVLHPPKSAINPMLYVGFLLAAAGAGMVPSFRPPGSPLRLRDAVERLQTAQEQLASRQCRRRIKRVVERVGGQDLERRPGLDDGGRSLTAREVDPPLRRHR